jgi:voltage-dependent potassium channel beta subunit
MEMEYRRLGKSGLQVSCLSFGAWVTFGRQVDNSTAEACMQLAYEHGVNFFDNAEAYGDGDAEIVMGEILQKCAWRRDTYLVSSKVFWGGKLPNQSGLCRKHVIEACHAALKRLQVDYLDLYFCHRPDPNTPIEETVRAMNTLIEQGKVLYWGTSEWSAAEIESAVEIAQRLNLIAPTMEQPQYNLFHRDRVESEYAPLYNSANGLGTTIWSPLASGLLTGKYNEGVPAESRLGRSETGWLREHVIGDEAAWAIKLEKLKALGALAQETGISMPHLAIGWCLRNPCVSTVILGASRMEQLQENLKVLEHLPRITDAVCAQIDQILQ